MPRDAGGMIDVAGLGMGIVRPGKIMAAFLSTEIRQPIASPVIQDPNPEI